MSDLELCHTCERYGECDVYSRLSSPGHDLLYSCVNYVPTSAKDIDVPNTDLSDYSDRLWRTAYERGKQEAVKHGHWLEDGYGRGEIVCSNCGEPCATFAMMKPRDRFCKWCGARMDEVRMDEDEQE